MTEGSRFHSVELLEDLCVGCTACAKICPTEAIRVRGGKAHINEERCTDCGACIMVCPVHAKVANTTPLLAIGYYDVKVALVPPSLYSQFGEDVTPDMLVQAVKMMGFDEVFEVADACLEITEATKLYLQEKGLKKPLISFTCPAVVNLIRVRYPDLIEHLLPLRSPLALSARNARAHIMKTRGIPSERIGVFALTGCPARMTRIRSPLTEDASPMDGAVSVAEIYGRLKNLLKQVDKNAKVSTATAKGVRWGVIGGEVKALGLPDSLYVDGIQNVIDLFEEIEKGNLYQFNLVEARVCLGGCIGGPLMVDNVYLARNKVKKICDVTSDELPSGFHETALKRYKRGDYAVERRVQPQLIDALDKDPKKALEKMRMRKEVLDQLPGIDCGACGAPNCRAMAEDIVQGRAVVHDCIFLLFQQANKLARQVYEWTNRIPISIRTRRSRDNEGGE